MEERVPYSSILLEHLIQMHNNLLFFRIIDVYNGPNRLVVKCQNLSFWCCCWTALVQEGAEP